MHKAIQLYASNRQESESLNAMVQRLQLEGHTVYNASGRLMDCLSLSAHVGPMNDFQIAASTQAGPTPLKAFGYGGPAMIRAADLSAVCAYCNDPALPCIDGNGKNIVLCGSCGAVDYTPELKAEYTKADLLSKVTAARNTVDFKG